MSKCKTPGVEKHIVSYNALIFHASEIITTKGNKIIKSVYTNKDGTPSKRHGLANYEIHKGKTVEAFVKHLNNHGNFRVTGVEKIS